uniref:PSI domain-containing protein n=1 Tax=Pyrodinium bahamense TaxID=73915 RepID=A0A7S0FAH9_9DINO|mmetsp:Transcript_15265/g.42163  ORF Transcript_15265/g.42163 Transcript_15265/m.42163 type:complete len:158 (+) Transcript_15265:67-540(+)|eukprot:CAMPEP_0179112744 /NCGR_PEP_ID=MMETSP0796-20121207/52721_1 /TAXON_ID=73915 /ORGANISM="Pyrodinium bahamense, Strain pbaha01" /LENGTH=157 /DNA_ID=CAMNT_0020810931 /DNA_START=67 /DNA_END=540 /DNA_ORIENTATION=+
MGKLTLVTLVACLLLGPSCGDDAAACGEKTPCSCYHDNSIFCINYSQCGTTFRPGICQTTNFQIKLDVDIGTKEPSGFELHEDPQKCCHWKDGPESHALEESLAEAMVDPSKNMEVFVIGLGLGGGFVAAVGAVSFLVVRLTRRRSYTREEPLLMAA